MLVKLQAVWLCYIISEYHTLANAAVFRAMSGGGLLFQRDWIVYRYVYL